MGVHCLIASCVVVNENGDKNGLTVKMNLNIIMIFTIIQSNLYFSK